MHSTITSKGQTTIPRGIRTALGIRPGDRLDYAIEGDRVTSTPPPTLCRWSDDSAPARSVAILNAPTDLVSVERWLCPSRSGTQDRIR